MNPLLGCSIGISRVPSCKTFRPSLSLGSLGGWNWSPRTAGCPCTQSHQHHSPAVHLVRVSQRREVSGNIFSCGLLKKKAFGFSGMPLGGLCPRMNPARVTCNTKVVLSQISRKAVQSPGRPFSCLPLVSFLSPFFMQSCVQITLPWNKDNCKVIGMKRSGIWTCFELTNPHPIFHCYYNKAGKQYAAHTPAANPPGRALTRDRAGTACQADAGRGATNITSGTHKHSRGLCPQNKSS